MFTNRKKIKIQGKTASHKKSLLKSLTIELIRNGKIKTTPKKAKALKSSFDKLVTKFKNGSDHSNAQVTSFFGTKNSKSILRFGKVVQEYLQDRNSGYTRVIRTSPRKGDNAEQSFVVLINYQPKEKKSKIQQVLTKQTSKKTSKKSEIKSKKK